RGLFFQPEPLVGETAAGPGLGAGRIGLHGFIEIAGRRLVVVDREVTQAAGDEQVGALGGKPERGGEIVDGELVLALALIERTAAVIGLRIVGLERDRLVEIGQGLGALALQALDHAAADIGHSVAGIERQRLVVIGRRQIELVGLAIDQAAIGIGLGVIRIEADRLVEIGQRLLVAPGFAEYRAAHVVGLRIVGMLFDDLAERRQVGRRRDVGRIVVFGGRRIAQRGATGERESGERKRDSARSN